MGPNRLTEPFRGRFRKPSRQTWPQLTAAAGGPGVCCAPGFVVPSVDAKWGWCGLAFDAPRGSRMHGSLIDLLRGGVPALAALVIAVAVIRIVCRRPSL